MKLKIEKVFRDKHTGKKYEVGNEIEFTEGRAKELLSDKRELVTQVKDTKKPVKKSKK